jgi:hypothetical protein
MENMGDHAKTWIFPVSQWARSLGVGFLAPAGVWHTLGVTGLPFSRRGVAISIRYRFASFQNFKISV